MKRMLLIFCAGIILMALGACHKDTTTSTGNNTGPAPKDTTPTFVPTGLHTDGFGPSHKTLTGTPFVFPQGVSLSGSIKTNINACTSSAFYECVTNGDLPYYMSLHNSNSVATTVIFPAGIVIPCPDTTIQGGVIVQPDTVIIPPTSSICVNLNAYCINLHRTFNPDIACGTMLITDNDNLTPLIILLSHKRPISDDTNEVLQKAIRHVSDSTGLTTDDIAAIHLFP
jgi:hypothetical protein